MERMKVEHRDAEIRCVPVGRSSGSEKAEPRDAHFATNGKETAHPVGETPGPRASRNGKVPR